MTRATELALENVRQSQGGPFGAVVVKGEQIVSEGTNQVVAQMDPSAHAEILAIRAACQSLGTFDLRGCELYASCEPCPMCLAAIYWARLDRVYFAGTRVAAARAGFDDELIYRELSLPLEQRRVEMIQLCESKSRSAFDAWLKKDSRLPY